jgi:hypothetical protein
MPKRRAVVRERLDRWLTPTLVPQRNSPIVERQPVITGCAGLWTHCLRLGMADRSPNSLRFVLRPIARKQ